MKSANGEGQEVVIGVGTKGYLYDSSYTVEEDFETIADCVLRELECTYETFLPDTPDEEWPTLEGVKQDLRDGVRCWLIDDWHVVEVSGY